MSGKGAGTGTAPAHRGETVWRTPPLEGCPPLAVPAPATADPARARAVTRKLSAWLTGLGVPGRALAELEQADFGRYAMLTYPDTADEDRLLLAAQAGVAYYYGDDQSESQREGINPVTCGDLAALAVNGPRPATWTGYRPPAVHDDLAWLRVMRAFIDRVATYASHAQLGRIQHEGAAFWATHVTEAVWRHAGLVPPAAEHVSWRQRNTFLPVVAMIDLVGGWELPASLYYEPRVRAATRTAAIVASYCNDLNSLQRELLPENQPTINLVAVLAAEHGCPLPEAITEAADIHNRGMNAYETIEATLLTDPAMPPPVARWLTGVRAWIGGMFEFEITSARYQTPVTH